MKLEPKRVATAEAWRSWAPYFQPDEFRCGASGEALMDADFMTRLFELRKRLAIPMVVTSGYRNAAHNKDVGGSLLSAHMEGRACDFHVDVAHMYDVLRAALALGFTGIGIRGRGDWARRFFHLDDADAIPPTRPRPWVWTYNGF